MGQSYAVELCMKSKDEAKTLTAVRAYMKRNPYHANFEEEKWKAQGGSADTVDGLVRLILAGWPKNEMQVTTDEKGFTTYKNYFYVCYGW